MNILFADNAPAFLATQAELLVAAGYQVLSATTLAEARRLLETGRVHLAILDIRMVDDEDERDVSGLDLAKDPAYRAIPKIILTGYPTYTAVREALGPALDGLPPAVAFVAKSEGPEAMIQAVKEAFEKHVRINWELVIRWSEREPLSFPHLVTLIEPGLDSAVLLDRAGELEDLFRKLFYTSSQITPARLLTRREGRITLEVTAYPPDGQPESLVVTCGLKPQMEKETESYKRFASLSARGGGTVWAGPVETLHFAAVAYAIPGVDVADTRTFSEYYPRNPSERVLVALDNLFQKALAPCYEQGRSLEKSRTLNELWLEELRLTGEKLPQAELARRVEALCREALAAGLLVIEHAPDALTFRFGDGTSVTYPNPASCFYEKSATVEPPVLCGFTHGRLDGAAFLVDRRGRSWLVDFGQVAARPLLYDFVTLETAIRFDLLDVVDPIAWRALETGLLSTAFSAEADAEVQKALSAIQRIRALALATTGSDFRSYLVGLLCHAIGRLAAYQPGVRCTRQELAPYAHALLLAAILCEKLAALTARPAEATSSLWIDKARREVWVEGRQIERVSKLEFTLLAFLFDHRGQVCSRDDILAQLYPQEIRDPNADMSDNRVDVIVGRLRKRIEPDPAHPRYVLTVRDIGYRLAPD